MKRSCEERRPPSLRTMLPSARKARSPWSWHRPTMQGGACLGSGSPDRSVDVLVEIPRGSRQKYERDQKTGRMRVARVLFSSTHYPAHYGVLTDTLARYESAM